MMTLLSLLFVASMAHAADAPNSSSSSAASLSGKRGSLSEGHETAAEESVEGTNSLTTNIGTVVPQAPTRKWNLEIYGEDYYEVDQANHGTGKMETAQYIGVNYTFSENLTGYIRQNFAASLDNTPDDKRSAKDGDDLRMGDTEVALATKNLAKWDGGSLNLTNRLYLPTGKYSMAGGEIAYLREILIASKTINRFLETGFAGDFRLAAFTKGGYSDKFGTEKQNRNVLMNPAVYLTGRATSKLSGTVYAGTIDKLYHSYGANASSHVSVTYLDTSISAQLLPQLALTVGAENDMNIGKGQIGHPELYRAAETMYYMNIDATL